jgi:hypothetical protein
MGCHEANAYGCSGSSGAEIAYTELRKWMAEIINTSHDVAAEGGDRANEGAQGLYVLIDSCADYAAHIVVLWKV